MSILVTGSEGGIGRVLTETLRRAGLELKTFDVESAAANSEDHLVGDLRNLSSVKQAVAGVEAVVHVGGVPGDEPGNAEAVLATNTQGTWNVLLAAADAGVKRVVVISSINALGVVGENRVTPLYLPIDDAHPRRPQSPYQLSKYLAEETCRFFTDTTDLTVLILRPVLVTYPERHYAEWQRSDERADWAVGEYCAYVDVRDVCRAVLCALELDGLKFGAFLLAADDTFSCKPTAELVADSYPDISWSPKESANKGLYLSLVDASSAHKVLGWHPQYSWRSARQQSGGSMVTG